MRTVKVRRLLRLLLLALFVILTSVANAPAPYWACSGGVEGEPCDRYGSDTGGGCRACSVTEGEREGVCRLATSCTDDPDTDVNECLYCS